MKNFSYQNTTKLIFGEDKIVEVANEISKLGPKTLLVMGGTSFIKNGYYESLVQALQEKGVSTYDFKGVVTPLLSKVREGIQICRDNQIDSIIGIGGGTVMDVAKAIAFGVKQKEDIWKFLDMEISEENRSHLPVITIVTYPSSGSEMDSSAQIDHDQTLEKRGLNSIFPMIAWLNPAYMKSIPEINLKYGQMTVFAQLSSGYLSLERSDLSESISLAFMTTVMDNLKRALNDSKDEEARKNLMLASSLSVSGITTLGKEGDWSLIPLVGMAQTILNVSYTEAMTILLPYWIKYIYAGQNIFKDYFKNIFDLTLTDLNDEQILKIGLDHLNLFYKEIGVATTFKELNPSIDKSVKKQIIQFAKNQGELFSQYRPFTPELVEEIMVEASGIASK
ncbi:MAG: iron-containing alcohol dehydrogenase [Enterococcus sp.]